MRAEWLIFLVLAFMWLVVECLNAINEQFGTPGIVAAGIGLLVALVVQTRRFAGSRGLWSMAAVFALGVAPTLVLHAFNVKVQEWSLMWFVVMGLATGVLPLLLWLGAWLASPLFAWIERTTGRRR